MQAFRKGFNPDWLFFVVKAADHFQIVLHGGGNSGGLYQGIALKGVKIVFLEHERFSGLKVLLLYICLKYGGYACKGREKGEAEEPTLLGLHMLGYGNIHGG